ncbi:Integrase [Psychroflexus gondwanensis ACAM 44]|uniref:Integrase n=1 Tax=Psychroflexus gondwanensis ACAM 44 TaxID=1189619 RepID=N1WQP0_9FLAO|nr:phage integrase SAM-like domain-containing protein [Psychroflexus gondwanensis]EMY82601.1 Integrase [Psychroflexus gondwanensis ACAM 44]
MASVNFLYRSNRNEAALTLRFLFRHQEKDYVFSTKTKLIITRKYWEKVHFKKRIKDLDSSFEKSRIQNELNNIESHVIRLFNDNKNSKIDKNWLKKIIHDFYYPKEIKNIPENIIDFIEFYINYRKNELKITSINKYRVIKNKLIRLENYRKESLSVKDINEDFKKEFVDYQKREGYAKNTIQKELAFIKTFCKQARYMGLEVSSQMDNLKTEKENIEKIYLNIEELSKIESLDNLPQDLDEARDWLVISCFCGQRISDFMRFNKEMIREENGKKFIEFTQRKTNKIMTVPLHHKILDILDKRYGEFPKAIFFHKYNQLIKTICKIAKIDDLVKGSRMKKIGTGKFKYRKKDGVYKKHELITSHVGRRSFASNYYGKIPTTYLIFITGHSSEKMFLNYMGKSNKDLAVEVSKYF